jgi:hypothetical protein
MDQGVARKAQQEPEGEMEKTETPGAAEAPAYLNFDSELGCWPADPLKLIPSIPSTWSRTTTRATEVLYGAADASRAPSSSGSCW